MASFFSSFCDALCYRDGPGGMAWTVKGLVDLRFFAFFNRKLDFFDAIVSHPSCLTTRYVTGKLRANGQGQLAQRMPFGMLAMGRRDLRGRGQETQRKAEQINAG
jgi:hypothetical protein